MLLFYLPPQGEMFYGRSYKMLPVYFTLL